MSNSFNVASLICLPTTTLAGPAATPTYLWNTPISKTDYCSMVIGILGLGYSTNTARVIEAGPVQAGAFGDSARATSRTVHRTIVPFVPEARPGNFVTPRTPTSQLAINTGLEKQPTVRHTLACSFIRAVRAPSTVDPGERAIPRIQPWRCRSDFLLPWLVPVPQVILVFIYFNSSSRDWTFRNVWVRNIDGWYRREIRNCAWGWLILIPAVRGNEDSARY